MMMMMMVLLMQTLKKMLYVDEIKSIYYNFVYLFWTFTKENSKGFSIIDPLSEQQIVIIQQSHDWPNIL